jgi:hypothetical protein
MPNSHGGDRGGRHESLQSAVRDVMSKAKQREADTAGSAPPPTPRERSQQSRTDSTPPAA